MWHIGSVFASFQVGEGQLETGVTRWVKRIAAACCVVVCVSCVGGADMATHRPQRRSSVEVGISMNGASASLPVMTAGLTVESAVFWVGDIWLVGERGLHPAELEITGAALDLASAGPTSFQFVDLRPGLYSNLHVDFDPIEGVDMLGIFGGERLAFQVTGRTPGGDSFVIRDTRVLELDVRAGDGVEVRPGEALEVLLRLDIDKWLSGIVLPDSKPIVVDERNTAMLDMFRSNLVRSATLELAKR